MYPKIYFNSCKFIFIDFHILMKESFNRWHFLKCCIIYETKKNIIDTTKFLNLGIFVYNWDQERVLKLNKN